MSQNVTLFFQKGLLLSKMSLSVTEKAGERLYYVLGIWLVKLQQVLRLNNKGEKGTFPREQAHPYVYFIHKLFHHSTIKWDMRLSRATKENTGDSLRTVTQAFHYFFQVAPRSVKYSTTTRIPNPTMTSAVLQGHMMQPT